MRKNNGQEAALLPLVIPRSIVNFQHISVSTYEYIHEEIPILFIGHPDGD